MVIPMPDGCQFPISVPAALPFDPAFELDYYSDYEDPSEDDYTADDENGSPDVNWKELHKKNRNKKFKNKRMKGR